MLVDLSPVIAATTQWLIRAYPPDGDALASTLAQVQARQATKVATWLRYPTSVDAGLMLLAGPGGAGRLDRLAGVGPVPGPGAASAWRTWVDEVVTSWAACLLADPVLASAAVAALGDCEHLAGLHCDFRRLTVPDETGRCSTALLRHPDLLAPIADLHRAALLELLSTGTVDAA